MKRTIEGLTRWEDFEKQLLKNKKFARIAEKNEPKYQLVRSLIRARIKNNLSQKELARRIGTKQPVISRLENMESYPSFSLLTRISEALGAKLHIYFQ